MSRAGALTVVLLLAGCVQLPGGADDAGALDITYDAIAIDTALGSFTAIVFCGETPKTCAFLRGLVDAGYYDGRAFGRVIPGFVIQEVDRTGGTTDQPEKIEGEFGTAVMFSAGAFGIARDADPDSGGSEFFVMDFATSRLYGNYTAFAQVVDGLDVVHAIARVPAVRTGPASSVAGAPPGSPVYFGVHDRVPVEPVEMTRVAWTNVTLAADVAARYPLQVGETFSTDTLRATLEWPADLAANRTSQLAWYLFVRDASPTASLQDPAPLDLAGASIRYDGAASGAVELAEDPDARGALSFAWTPPLPGLYQFHLERGGDELALGNVTVQR